ncbi:hypothetical protein [Sphingobium yanoikuyae]|uniref:hypothetical protein n=1 Tax=Sphingobium yanoikuyae TaxID=13690 RepID=UPI00345E784E
MPVPGLILFWIIGSPRFPEWRRARFGELDPWFGGIAARLLPHAPSPDPDRAPIGRLGRKAWQDAGDRGQPGRPDLRLYRGDRPAGGGHQRRAAQHPHPRLYLCR